MKKTHVNQNLKNSLLNEGCLAHANILETGAVWSDFSYPNVEITPRNLKTKVLHYYPDYGHYGGIERCIETLSRTLKHDGKIENVISCSANGLLYQKLFTSDMPVYGVKHSTRFQNPHSRVLDVATVRSLQNIISIERPDVLHCHIGGMELSHFKAFDIPIVYSFHGYGSLYENQSQGNAVKRAFKKYLIKKHGKAIEQSIDCLTFVSKFEQERFLKHVLNTETISNRIIPNGVDIEYIRSELKNPNNNSIKKQLKINEDSKLVSFINRLDDNKQPDLFIDLVEQLLQGQRPYKLTVKLLICS